MAHTASPAALIGMQLEAQAGDIAGSLERLESLAAALQGKPNPRGYAPEYAAPHADEILASIASVLEHSAQLLEAVRAHTEGGAERANAIEYLRAQLGYGG